MWTRVVGSCTRIGVLLVGLVLCHPPEVARGQGGSAHGPGEREADAGRQLEAGFRTVCTPLDGASPEAFEQEISRLAVALAPLLSPDVDDPVRLEYARLSVARARFERSQAVVATYDELLEQIAASEPAGIPAILEDLDARIDDIVSLRAFRATLARLVPGAPGQGVRLELRPLAGASRLEEGVAGAALGEFALARARGVDCTRSSLYAFFHTRSLVVGQTNAPAPVRHRDILVLRQRVTRLERAWAACVLGGGDGCTVAPSIDRVVDVYQAVRGAHERALEVLGKAVALLSGALREEGVLSPFEGALVADVPDPIRSSPVVASAAKPDPGVSGEDPPVAPGEAVTEPSVEDEASRVVAVAHRADTGEPNPVERVAAGRVNQAGEVGDKADHPVDNAAISAQPGDDVASDEGGSLSREASAESNPRSGAADGQVAGDERVARAGRGDPNRVDAAIARRRLDIINEVMTQANLLRSAADRGYLEPLSLANNLLQRSKRIFRLADMLAVSEQDGRVYRCTLSEGAIHIEFETSRRELAKMRVVVDERYLDKTVMTWSVSVVRRDDQNFTISADFDRLSPTIVVERGKLARMPNHQELLVLMNRLSALVYDEGEAPVRTASR